MVVNEHSVITNTFLSQIGQFSTQIDPVITNPGYNEIIWEIFVKDVFVKILFIVRLSKNDISVEVTHGFCDNSGLCRGSVSENYL